MAVDADAAKTVEHRSGGHPSASQHRAVQRNGHVRERSQEKSAFIPLITRGRHCLGSW